MGAGFGLILAATLTHDQLYSWGWRVPFLLGVVIAPVALYIRRQLPETIEESQTHRSTAAVLSELVRHHLRPVILGVFIICGGTVSTYVLNYMTTYAITTLHLSAAVGNTLGLVNSAAQIAGLAVGVWLDRQGRKRMLILSRVAYLLIVYPVYLILTSPDASLATVVASNAFLGFVFAISIGATYAFLAEAFPQSVRSSGLAILYALGVMIFGGTTQFVVTWLIKETGDPLVPAWYQMAATAASIVGVLLLVPHPEVLHERSVLAASRA
jgi:MFS family permease